MDLMSPPALSVQPTRKRQRLDHSSISPRWRSSIPCVPGPSNVGTATAVCNGDDYDPLDASLEEMEKAGWGRDREERARRESMYVEIFQEMLTTVLDKEAYLFTQKEMRVFEAFLSMHYEPRYLFVRLFSRKRGWHRLDRLSYDRDVADMRRAVDGLCMGFSHHFPSWYGSESQDVCTFMRDKGKARAVSPLRSPTSPGSKENAPPFSPTSVDSNKVSVSDSQGGNLCFFAETEAALLSDTGKAGIEEALGMLSLDELKILGKRMKTTAATTRAAIIQGLLSSSCSQSTLFACAKTGEISLTFDAWGKKGTQFHPFLAREVGRCLGMGLIRLNDGVCKLFERVAMVYYRSIAPDEKPLTTAVLARCHRRRYPSYVHDRSSELFPSRDHLLAYERALDLEAQMIPLIEERTRTSLQAAKGIFEIAWPEWLLFVSEKMDGENSPKVTGTIMSKGVARYCWHRYHPGHILTRVVYKGAHVLGRLREYEREKKVLRALLEQTAFRRGKRGAWYDRLALVLSTYGDQHKSKGKHEALEVCIRAVEDPDTHLIYQSSLQRRIARLERQLRIPRSEQHDFIYVQLKACRERTVVARRALSATSIISSVGAGRSRSDPGAYPSNKRRISGEISRSPSISLKKPASCAPTLSKATGQLTLGREQGPPALDGRKAGGKSMWRGRDGEICNVETIALQSYEDEGYKGFHSENGILSTLFTLIFWDILFYPVPGAFETPYQRAPLDLATDAFNIARAPLIRARLEEIRQGRAPELVRVTDERERKYATWAVGVDWKYERQDLVEIAECLGGRALAIICQMLCEEYGQRGSGMPDLCLWRYEDKSCRFVEVKGPGDRLSDAQRVWIDVLLGAGVDVEVCKVVEDVQPQQGPTEDTRQALETGQGE